MNALLGLLARREQAALREQCEVVPLVLGEDVQQPGDAVAHVLFPTSGYLSLVTGTDVAPGMEVGMVGIEGMLGTHLLLGVRTTSLRAMVQGGGDALRLPVAALLAAIAASPTLDRVLKRYLHVLMTQFTTAAPCLRYHAIGPRLARWLLMMHDRSGRVDFHATHEFLSLMLGVRRAGVTIAAGELQAKGLIHYERGLVQVLDRGGLEAAACGCYALDQAAYLDVMLARR
ncbi:Crp/Fnr family transcriptional regulator [Ramlibacter sp. XY19]|uniref:Crp/Fnr family transcriptional regulator n=1 Tax=Ramlibacter paludis TaxID=2908000 RepID=UPI0023DB867C|nr:Crp/Fnr family transcriptional regulator [Ramlibacter paludis]MCG2592921.1 Crp/Fnr family transcriptional regulator [Ramlibacter paludis]